MSVSGHFDMWDIHWAAEECERQRSGEMSVYHLLYALAFQRLSVVKTPSVRDIAILGHLVEPDKNPYPTPGETEGIWRDVGVTIGGVIPLPKPELLDRLMVNLVEAWGSIDSDEWYREFEEIHPFVDGNGRVGSILWNLHRATLHGPVAPPDFWSEKNQEMFELTRAQSRAEIMAHLMSNHAPKS